MAQNNLLMPKKLLNWVFIVQLVLFGLIVTGILPRVVVPYLAVALATYVVFAPLEDATLFFVRSIPFFIAIPLTATFDNFNTWRILSVIIFLRWFISVPNLRQKIKDLHSTWLSHVLHALVFMAILSIIPALDKMLAVKRIIYFLNLGLMGLVIFDLTQKQDFAKRLIKNISIPVIIVTVVGFIQLGSTYIMDIYQFMGFWAGKVQFNQFGAGWSYIAYNLGNTWFAYYGEQISLRMFSLFPDSHSFPQFILLGLPAIFALALRKFDGVNLNLKKLYRTRTSLIIVWVPLIFLAAILTGTRGIWAASLGAVGFGLILIWMFKKSGIQENRKIIFKYMLSYTVLFFLLFSIALPLTASPQFELYKMNSDLLARRVRSIISFGETSNKERLRIWKLSLESIKNHPLLGVGIGNFPVVLNQDLSLAKAGSSAHNIYLHIAAEMGIPALVFALWFLWILMQKVYYNFISSKDWEVTVCNGAALIFIPWILTYCLTDVALFDERAFLLFVATVSLVLATKNPD
jgi:O-antigen ligase